MKLKLEKFGHIALASLLITLPCLSLSSCAGLDRDYQQQFWERCQILAEQSSHKHHYKIACAMAEQAVSAAERLGAADSRLGLSLCCLGDAEKASGHKNESESAYKRSIKVLELCQKNKSVETSPNSAANKNADQTKESLLLIQSREDLAHSLSCLADLYATSDQYKESAELFERAASLYESLLASNPAKVADCIMGQKAVQCFLGLAQVCVASKNYDEADQSYQRALKTAVSSDCPEYLLRDIRDSYLKLLQLQGSQDEARGLAADALYAQYTADGYMALSERDFTAAEILFRKAFQEAKRSIFSDRRLMRSLSNLVAVFCRDGKVAELEKCSKMADSLMQSRQIGFDRDYDKLLDDLANFYFISGHQALAAAALEKQLDCRVKHYGPNSKEVAALQAFKGRVELKLNNLPAAERSASLAYQILKPKYFNERRCAPAILQTAELMADLNHFEQAEELKLQLVALLKSVRDPADFELIGQETSLFILYHRFHKSEKAGKIISEMVAGLNKGNAAQRAGAFPYLVLILSFCTALGWYDVAKPIAALGQAILKKDLAGAFPDESSKNNWTKDIAIMDKQLNTTF